MWGQVSAPSEGTYGLSVRHDVKEGHSTDTHGERVCPDTHGERVCPDTFVSYNSSDEDTLFTGTVKVHGYDDL
jgi:hypothetical protein